MCTTVASKRRTHGAGRHTRPRNAPAPPSGRRGFNRCPATPRVTRTDGAASAGGAAPGRCGSCVLAGGRRRPVAVRPGSRSASFGRTRSALGGGSAPVTAGRPWAPTVARAGVPASPVNDRGWCESRAPSGALSECWGVGRCMTARPGVRGFGRSAGGGGAVRHGRRRGGRGHGTALPGGGGHAGRRRPVRADRARMPRRGGAGRFVPPVRDRPYRSRVLAPPAPGAG